jgi:hypothetical protein
MELQPVFRGDYKVYAVMIIASTFVLFAVFFGPTRWGENVGYWLVGAYWVAVVSGGGICATVEVISEAIGLVQKPPPPAVPGESPDSRAFYAFMWAAIVLLITLPAAVGTIVWLMGFREPNSLYFYLLVGSPWLLVFMMMSRLRR